MDLKIIRNEGCGHLQQTTTTGQCETGRLYCTLGGITRTQLDKPTDYQLLKKDSLDGHRRNALRKYVF
jgi:hypothetical protein